MPRSYFQFVNFTKYVVCTPNKSKIDRAHFQKRLVLHLISFSLIIVLVSLRYNFGVNAQFCLFRILMLLNRGIFKSRSVD